MPYNYVVKHNFYIFLQLFFLSGVLMMKLFLSLTASGVRMHRADLRAKRSPQERPRAAEI